MSTNRYQSALEVPNVRKFIAFRLFFNARFYYPVFAILFTDFGLTLGQFAVLNAIWAITIVLAEVPSGALADIVGRRTLVIFASFLMMLEMLVVSFVPPGSGELLFWAFAINRVLSGLAEAAASGADEALAYDSLKEHNLEEQWPKVLERLMVITSVAFATTGLLGAALYDPTSFNWIGQQLGFDWNVLKDDTVRIPIWLTLALAPFAIWAAFGMQNLKTGDEHEAFSWQAIRASFVQIVNAGKWILRTPFALVIILGGFVFDSLARLFATLESTYLRVIDFPEWSFGLIASGLSLMMIFSGKAGKVMSERFGPFHNALIMGLFTLGCFFGLTLVIPYWGIGFAALAFMVMSLSGFFVSHYLNRIVDSRQRATVLSFKSLTLNLAYGAATFLYGVLLSALREDYTGTERAIENAVFAEALQWFPWSFLALFAGLLVFASLYLKDKRACFRKG